MGVVLHADDYGITVAQARAILALVDRSGRGGAKGLRSASAFANSPAFREAAELARPCVESGAFALART